MARGSEQSCFTGENAGMKNGLVITCPRTGKRVYGSLGVALAEAHRFGWRAYPCEFCGWWHLSSRLVDAPTWLRNAKGEK